VLDWYRGLLAEGTTATVDRREVDADAVILDLRPLDLDDLSLVRSWLADPGVAPWFLTASSLEEELDDLRRAVVGEEATEALLVSWRGRPIGWCQWYLCSDYPDHAEGVGAHPGDVGIDYAIGDSRDRSRGLGTALIAALVDHIRSVHPGAGVIADPEATNLASRAVLERNGFVLLDERVVPSESTPNVMAIYRLPAERP
jgi:RimJ/RimL family protein N-acetyltransferase